MSEINFELLNDYNTLSKRNKLPKQVKLIISNNLNQKFTIRDYQKEAFVRFEEYFEKFGNPAGQRFEIDWLPFNLGKDGLVKNFGLAGFPVGGRF